MGTVQSEPDLTDPHVLKSAMFRNNSSQLEMAAPWLSQSKTTGRRELHYVMARLSHHSLQALLPQVALTAS